MDEIIQRFNKAQVRYALIGGQAMRLSGMPRFSMDWDFLIPPRDQPNLDLINKLLDKDLDMSVVPLGARGENFVQTYQTQWGILQFHLGGPGFPAFEEVERAVVVRHTEEGTPVRCISDEQLLAAKQAAGRPQDLLDAEFLIAKRAPSP